MKYYRLVRVGPFKNAHSQNGNIARFLGPTGLVMGLTLNTGSAGGVLSFKNVKGETMKQVISANELGVFFTEVPEEVFKDACWRANSTAHFEGSRAMTQNESLSTVKELKELTFNVAITKDNYEQAIAEIKKAFE